MKLEAWCSQCSFRVGKDVNFESGRSELGQVREAFEDEAKAHEHDGKRIRVSWESGGSWREIELGT